MRVENEVRRLVASITAGRQRIRELHKLLRAVLCSHDRVYIPRVSTANSDRGFVIYCVDCGAECSQEFCLVDRENHLVIINTGEQRRRFVSALYPDDEVTVNPGGHVVFFAGMYLEGVDGALWV